MLCRANNKNGKIELFYVAFYSYNIKQHVKDGHFPVHRRFLASHCSFNAITQNNGKQKCDWYCFVNLGLSYRTQELFLVVFLARYIDLFLGWKTLYVFVMKIVFISLTGYTIYLMKFKKPYSLSLDR